MLLSFRCKACGNRGLSRIKAGIQITAGAGSITCRSCGRDSEVPFSIGSVLLRLSEPFYWFFSIGASWYYHSLTLLLGAFVVFVLIRLGVYPLLYEPDSESIIDRP